MLTRKDKLLQVLEDVLSEVEMDFTGLHAAASLYLKVSDADQNDKQNLQNALDEFAQNYFSVKAIN